MSEKMYPIPFDSLMNWVTSEYAQCGDVFGVHKHYHASGKSLPIFGERIETPFGPAAGPNSQLAQNIIAAYAAGARFFEVKTVQKMDGAELAACVLFGEGASGPDRRIRHHRHPDQRRLLSP